ncbi:MAG: DHH family phosphoesterase [Vicinamibacteria bacterium]
MRAPLIWQPRPCDEPRAAAFGRELGISTVAARLLLMRGVDEPDAARRFLRPSLDQLHDPLGLTDMGAAVERIEAAIARGERIAVHGDYDVDGITSTVILRRAIELLGGNVVHFIPERLTDGYGLQPATLERLRAEGVHVVVSVDCGIRGAEAARRAKAVGLDLIITDHHEPDDELPDAVAVVNPKRHDCPYPDKNLAGVGVALKLVQALCARAGRESWLPAFVKIAAIGTLADVVVDGDEFRREAGEAFAPARLHVDARKLRDLRYGENPHQPAAWYAVGEPAAGLGAPEVLQGKELSYTNLLDLDAAARIVLEFDEPAASVIKHTNPCGAATGATIAEAYVRAREADALAAFGGIVGLNRPVDEDTAKAIVTTFIEAVIAPGVDEAARAILATKPNLRVVVADVRALAETGGAMVWRRELRSVLGALLLQERDQVVEARVAWPDAALKVVTKRQPTPEEWQALGFAWRVMAHVKSNTVIFTDAVRTLAIGAGQMSRVDAVKVAAAKASGWKLADGARPLAGSVAASDAFFPFRDGLDAVAAAGATAVVQPGGSVRDAEVIAAADEHNLAMVFTGRRHFRH